MRLNRFTRLGDRLRVERETLHLVHVVGSQGRRQAAVSSAEVDDQPALHAGLLEDLLRIFGGCGRCIGRHPGHGKSGEYQAHKQMAT